jgi:hypothetical protein
MNNSSNTPRRWPFFLLLISLTVVATFATGWLLLHATRLFP